MLKMKAATEALLWAKLEGRFEAFKSYKTTLGIGRPRIVGKSNFR